MIFSDDNSYAILPESKTFVVLGNTAMASSPMSKLAPLGAVAPTSPQLAAEVDSQNWYIPWGEGNRFPLDVIDVIKKDPVIPQLIRWKASVAAGRGVRAVQVTDIDSTGQETYEVLKDPEIKAFQSNPQIYRWLIEAYTDLYSLQNQGSEMIISKDRSKITNIIHQEMKYARYLERKKGVVTEVCLNANWPSVQEKDQYSTILPVIDIYGLDPIAQVREASNKYKFWYPGSYPSPGDDLYQTPTWWSLEKSEIMSIRRAIPKFKKSLLERRMMLVWHVEIPGTYWAMRFPGFEKKSEAEKRAIHKKVLKDINDNLTNPNNSGKAFFSEYAIGLDGKELGHWKINQLTDNQKEGKDLADFHESTANVFYAFGVDPTLPGFASSEMGQRSGGSDKREAWLLYQESIISDRQLITAQLDFIAEYNGWKTKYPDFKFIHIDKVLTTLDTGKGTQKVVS